MDMAKAAERCGFFRAAGIVSEADLRTAIRDAAIGERSKWFDAVGNAIAELTDSQFGHLARYWLGRQDTLRSPTVTHVQARALDPAVDYGVLLQTHLQPTTDTQAGTVAADLLASAPTVGAPPDAAERASLVKEALLNTFRTREDIPAPRQWSSAFISSCIRGVAITLGLEVESGGSHVGQNVLLKAHEGHRMYVKEAYRRRMSTPPVTETYQAFAPHEHPVEVGDILVGDRMATSPDKVVTFDDIPLISDQRHDMHGDIVVAVTPTYAEAIGGNIGYSDPVGGDPCDQPGSEEPFNVRRRRYPLTTDGKLDVDPDQRFVQENNSGHLPSLPLVCPVSPGNFHQRSMGRMFVVLKPIAQCETL
jgi:hypothetical protein